MRVIREKVEITKATDPLATETKQQNILKIHRG
jgi:hypothetical protein